VIAIVFACRICQFQVKELPARQYSTELVDIERSRSSNSGSQAVFSAAAVDWICCAVAAHQGVPPTAIRQGDNVTLQVQNNGNNSYYTNYVQIN
jgi:hypothetical protein